MAATRLNTDNIRRILAEMLNSMELYGVEGKDAEQQLCYISGAVDMANKVIETIEELGGK